MKLSFKISFCEISFVMCSPGAGLNLTWQRGGIHTTNQTKSERANSLSRFHFFFFFLDLLMFV